jgi:hypothetical protein
MSLKFKARTLGGKGKEQDSRPGVSPSPAQYLAGVAVYFFLEDTAPLFKWPKYSKVPRRPPLFPFLQMSFEETEKPAPMQEDELEYDLFLFWPSLSNRDVASLYGVIVLLLT